MAIWMAGMPVGLTEMLIALHQLGRWSLATGWGQSLLGLLATGVEGVTNPVLYLLC